ncbi:hypothetical protein DS838_003042 [Geotrichum bryndzae]|nr:hypothetical protein DUD61_000595 [Geotrichum candidum]KAI9212079.1 hypothetical protein DS838_003042 [Geotrichum bryndzae]
MPNRTPEEENLYQQYFHAIEQVVLSPKPTLTELTGVPDPSSNNINNNKGVRRNQGQDLLILDSSFNPPHAAHALLLQRSLSQLLSRAAAVAGGGPAALRRPAAASIKAVLLFATANADKAVKAASVSALVATYAERAMLMRKFLDQQPQSQIHQAQAAPATAATTAPDVSRDGDLIFAVGFDTIVRVFAPHYYTDIPGGINAALGRGPFRFVVMTRDASSYPGTNSNAKPHDTSKTQPPQTGGPEPDDDFLAQQQQLQAQLTELGLWDYWQHRIDWVRGDASSFGVSSSRIRQLIGQGSTNDSHKISNDGNGDSTGGTKHTAEEMCGPLVYDYILRAGLYRAAS